MTRINNFHILFKPNPLQPSGFYGTERRRAFAGNHPTQRHKTVHFNSDSSEMDRLRDAVNRTNKINLALKEFSSDNYIERLEAGTKLIYLIKQVTDLNLYETKIRESTNSTDLGTKILALQILLSNCDKKYPTKQSFLQRQFEEAQLKNEILSTTKEFLPILKEKLKGESLDEKIIATNYLKNLAKIIDIKDLLPELAETLKSEDEFLVENSSQAISEYGISRDSINGFESILIETLGRCKREEIKINCLRGLYAISLRNGNIKPYIPIINKYIDNASEMISHLAILSIKVFSKRGNDISSSIEALERAAEKHGNTEAVCTLVSHIDYLKAPWYIKLVRSIRDFMKD